MKAKQYRGFDIVPIVAESVVYHGAAPSGRGAVSAWKVIIPDYAPAILRTLNEARRFVDNWLNN